MGQSLVDSPVINLLILETSWPKVAQLHLRAPLQELSLLLHFPSPTLWRSQEITPQNRGKKYPSRHSKKSTTEFGTSKTQSLTKINYSSISNPATPVTTNYLLNGLYFAVLLITQLNLTLTCFVYIHYLQHSIISNTKLTSPFVKDTRKHHMLRTTTFF